MGYLIVAISDEDRALRREIVRQAREKLEELNKREFVEAFGRLGEAAQAATLPIEGLNEAISTAYKEESLITQLWKRQRPPRSLGILKQKAACPPARPVRYQNQRGRKR